MDDFRGFLRPDWGSEKWIMEGWEQISADEKKSIKQRLDELFKDGLPLEIKQDKSLYVHAFSLLAQLEVLAIQVPLKFKDKMSSQENRERMHHQLLDEIFHGLVFTKILYLLCDPYAIPPEYNENVEKLCNFVRNEDCPQIAVMLLNLIAEGWIEEAFKCYAEQNIAPKVFNTILADENRHVCEADLYRDIGLPDSHRIKEKLEYLEEQLLVNFFLQHKYVLAATALLGVNGAIRFIQSLNNKHQQQLKKINLHPGKKWATFMQFMQNAIPHIQQFAQQNDEVEMTPMRQILMTQWSNSSDATMVSQSNIDITCIDFFSKKYPPETLTTLMLQAVSLWLKENEVYRSFLHYKKLYRSREAYVGVIVQLPGCGDQIGTIAFANCHELSTDELAQCIRTILPLMAYCFQKRKELEKAYPHLQPINKKNLYDFAYEVYGYPLPGSFIATVSNVGPWGYTDAKSPLFKNEVMKFVMLQVERKQVWNNHSKTFEIRDHLPLSISADHRVFDGNTPVPGMLNDTFQRMFKQMQENGPSRSKTPKTIDLTSFIQSIDHLIELNVDFAHKCLSALQTVWPDFLMPEELLALNKSKAVIASHYSCIP